MIRLMLFTTIMILFSFQSDAEGQLFQRGCSFQQVQYNVRLWQVSAILPNRFCVSHRYAEQWNVVHLIGWHLRHLHIVDRIEVK